MRKEEEPWAPSHTHFQAREGPSPGTGSLVDCKANSRFHTLIFRDPAREVSKQTHTQNITLMHTFPTRSNLYTVGTAGPDTLKALF